MPKVNIHLARINKPTRVYSEGLVSDDDRMLRTYSEVPGPSRARLTGNWQKVGLLPPGCLIAAVSKRLFYHETFSILDLLDADGITLGYYCDLATPLEKRDGEYYLTDLILDVWVFPDKTYRILDRDEYAAAVQAGLVDPAQQEIANRTLARLEVEIRAGIFPSQYL
jgi:hypothetical protein